MTNQLEKFIALYEKTSKENSSVNSLLIEAPEGNNNITTKALDWNVVKSASATANYEKSAKSIKIINYSEPRSQANTIKFNYVQRKINRVKQKKMAHFSNGHRYDQQENNGIKRRRTEQLINLNDAHSFMSNSNQQQQTQQQMQYYQLKPSPPSPFVFGILERRTHF